MDGRVVFGFEIVSVALATMNGVTVLPAGIVASGSSKSQSSLLLSVQTVFAVADDGSWPAGSSQQGQSVIALAPIKGTWDLKQPFILQL